MKNLFTPRFEGILHWSVMVPAKADWNTNKEKSDDIQLWCLFSTSKKAIQWKKENITEDDVRWNGSSFQKRLTLFVLHMQQKEW